MRLFRAPPTSRRQLPCRDPTSITEADAPVRQSVASDGVTHWPDARVIDQALSQDARAISPTSNSIDTRVVSDYGPVCAALGPHGLDVRCRSHSPNTECFRCRAQPDSPLSRLLLPARDFDQARPLGGGSPVSHLPIPTTTPTASRRCLGKRPDNICHDRFRPPSHRIKLKCEVARRDQFLQSPIQALSVRAPRLSVQQSPRH
jgi:hypothetical protein